MSAFLFRFKANDLEKMRGYPHFSFWISIALAKIYRFRLVLIWRKNLCNLLAPSLTYQTCPVDQVFISHLHYSDSIYETERENQKTLPVKSLLSFLPFGGLFLYGVSSPLHINLASRVFARKLKKKYVSFVHIHLSFQTGYGFYGKGFLGAVCSGRALKIRTSQ